MRTRKKLSVILTFLLGMLIIISSVSAAELGPMSDEVKTGERIEIFGVDFQPNQNADIILTRPDGNQNQLTRGTNEEGDIFYTFTASQEGIYSVEVSDGESTMTTEVTVIGSQFTGNSPLCSTGEVFNSCFGTPNSCDTILNQNSCESSGCSWGQGTAQRELFSEDFQTGNPPTDWAVWTSNGNGIAYVSSSNCGSGECLNGDGGPSPYFLDKQSDIDLSTCQLGSAQFHIDSVDESGFLESTDCMYVWFSNNSGATWESRTEIFCNDNPSSTFSTNLANSFLTQNMRIRIEKQNFGGSSENAYLDDFRVTCEVQGEICTGSPNDCSSFSNQDSCVSAGCSVECREATFCGDGEVQNPNDDNLVEQCDDGNDNDGDGCSSLCQIETGWECNDNSPSRCQAINPQLQESCGLDIVYIMDSSGSISNTELNDMKNFYTDLTNALLPNTETEIAFVDFGTTGVLTLDYTDNKTALLDAINAPNSGGQTNWQDALITAHDEFNNRLDKPDLYVFASDGEPNRIGSGPTLPTITPFAVFFAAQEANDIKLDGVRIETLGVGNSVDPNNFFAISSSDAFTQEAQFDQLVQEIESFASATCNPEITVTKLVDGEPVQGWEFTTQVDGGNAIPPVAITNSSGQALFEINRSTDVAIVSINEVLQQGFIFESAMCTLDGQPIGIPINQGVTNIPVTQNNEIICTFENRECDDADNDGVCDEDDMCPESMQGEPVDQMGCDIYQFCGIVSCGPDCIYADFMGDEPGVQNPNDCIVAIAGHDSDALYPVCVPTVDTPMCSGTQGRPTA